MIHRHAWDYDIPLEQIAEEAARAPWLDRLVELHVLVEHGDPAAIEAAGPWLETDPEARRVWEAVQHSCDRLRASGGTTATAAAIPRPGPA